MNLKLLACAVLVCALSAVSAEASLVVDLKAEFDGNPPSIFGTIELTQNGDMVDFEIIANSSALGGGNSGDIHEFYFNLPFAVTGLSVLNPGGVSDKAIGSFSILGPNPSIAGGAGASFEWGVSFGNGGGPPGNGILNTATFTLDADQALSINDFLTEFSTPNNTDPVYVAVHFQNTDVFNATSETIGGRVVHTPEPASMLIWGGGLASIAIGRRFARRKKAA